jgi:predicted GNAT family acetyltransferase
MTAAIERNLQECFKSFAAIDGAIVTDTPHLVAVRCPIPLTFTNGVSLAKFEQDTVDEQVAGVIAPFRDAGLPLRWWVTPSSSPNGLNVALERQGCKRVFQIPTMSANLFDINDEFQRPDGFSLVAVSDLAGLRVWSKTLTVGFEMPGESTYLEWIDAFTPFGFGESRKWRHYIGMLNDEAVAISSMFLGSEAAGIYHVVTLPQARGLGIGTLVTLAPLLEAREMGYQFGVLQSSPMGLSVYSRIGFQEQFVADFYTWRPLP